MYSSVTIGLHHVQLAAPPGSEAGTRRFYGELLGLPEIPKPEALRGRGGVWFELGEQQLHIGIEDEFRPAEKAHPALRVDSGHLDELATRLQAAGVEVSWDEAVPEFRRFFTHDPWGNRLELLSLSAP